MKKVGLHNHFGGMVMHVHSILLQIQGHFAVDLAQNDQEQKKSGLI